MKWILLKDQKPEEGLYYILSPTEFKDLMPSIAYFDPKYKNNRWYDYMLSLRKEEERWHDSVKYWMKIEMPEDEKEAEYLIS